MTIFRTCLVVGDKRVCVFCFAKALRTVLDYWQFENLHSLSFAIAKQLLISIFSLGRRSVRYCSLRPCQNPLCRQSAFLIFASNPYYILVLAFFTDKKRIFGDKKYKKGIFWIISVNSQNVAKT